MAVTIATLGSADSGMAGHTRVAYDSNGVLWSMLHSGTNNRWEFWYSTNDGTTWTELTALRITESASGDLASFTINPTDDFAAFAMDGSLRVIAGITTTSSAWVTVATANPDGDISDIVAFRKPLSTNYYIAWTQTGSGEVQVVEVSSGGVYASNPVSDNVLGTARSLDFNHTGDGYSVAGFAPHLYVVSDSAGAIYFTKFTYSSADWTAGPVRTINPSSTYDVPRLAFDGARALIVAEQVTGNAAFYAERDAADTTTTVRALPALAGGAEDSIVVGHDTNGDAVVAIIDASDDVEYVVYDRSGGSWGSWTVLEADSGVQTGSLAMAKYTSSSQLPVLWQTTAGAYKHENISFNVAPSAPTWLTPAASSAQDADATLPVTWQFNDDDAGDSQSAYALRRVISAVTTYYNASAGTWDGTEVKNTSTTSGVTLPATWGADGDAVALSVKTWDALDTEGVYGSALNLTASTKVDPVLTAPADAGTITTNKVTVTWTATEQTARRIRILTSADVVLYDSGKVTTTVKTFEVPTILSDGLTGAKAEIRTWNNDDLESSTDTHTFDVDFVEPAASTIVVAADAVSGYISVTITEPTPTGGQPTVTSHDLFVRVASGGRPDGERPVGGDGIRIVAGSPDAVLYDYAAGSGIDYEYRVLAIADNGTSTFGAWT